MYHSGKRNDQIKYKKNSLFETVLCINFCVSLNRLNVILAKEYQRLIAYGSMLN